MHTRLTTDTHCGVYAMKDVEGHRAWVGEVTHPADDPFGAELEQRWDAFARLMFAHGLEPAQLWPNHSVLVDGVVTDRYRLQVIEPEGAL